MIFAIISLWLSFVAIGVSPEYYMKQILMCSIILFANILFATLLVGFKRWKIDFVRHVHALVIHIRSKPYYMLLLYVALQMFIIVLIFVYIFLRPLHAYDALQITFIISITIFILMTIKIVQIIAEMQLERSYQSQQEAHISYLTRMLTSVRGQRHDFANHVQVMYSMLCQHKYDALHSYMKEVDKELQSMNVAVVEFPSPGLSALVQAKSVSAIEKKIRFDYLIHTPSRTFGFVTSVDLVRIIEDLVDNAFDEVVKLPAPEREVRLEVYSYKGELYIMVANRGANLSNESIGQIFQPGYTTSGDGHTGLGLANVLERVSSYRGQVSVESDPERGVVFTIRITYREKAKSRLA